tara:strand:- start:1029 stop:1244 length:216 start_codon:yes stop_codon:yes gene_type:complete
MSGSQLATCLLCLFAASATLADRIELRNGQTLEGQAQAHGNKVVIAGKSSSPALKTHANHRNPAHPVINLG